MSTTDIEIPHKLGVTGAKLRIEQLVPDLEKEFSVECAWVKESILRVSRKGLSAELSIFEDRVQVGLEVGFFLKAMGPAIRSGITRRLGDVLG